MSSTAAWLALTLALSEGAASCNDGTRVGEWTCARTIKAQQTAPSQNGVRSPFPGIENQTLGTDPTRDDALGLPVTGRETVPSVSFTGRSFDGGKWLIGRLSQESGISAGYEYSRRELWDRWFSFTLDAQWSVRKYQKLRFLAELASAPESPWALVFNVVQRNYPEQAFFGIGPNSRSSPRTNYSLDATDVGTTTKLMPAPWSVLEAFGGMLNTNTGPGKDMNVPSVEDVFRPAQAPGLNVQPDYWYWGASIRFDYRKESPNPVSGGYYQAAWTRYADRELSRFSFNQYTAEVRQYFPVFDVYRVLALHAMASFADPLRGNDVPFFMMGKLGGPDSLRGFSNSRFYDKNFLLLSAEYRWQLSTQMDAVVFTDAGNVFPDPRDISLKNLDASYGLGVRLKTPYGPLFRLEYAFSNEKQRLMFIFTPAF